MLSSAVEPGTLVGTWHVASYETCDWHDKLVCRDSWPGDKAKLTYSPDGNYTWDLSRQQRAALRVSVVKGIYRLGIAEEPAGNRTFVLHRFFQDLSIDTGSKRYWVSLSAGALSLVEEFTDWFAVAILRKEP